MARRILTWQEKEWAPGRKQLGVHAWGRTFRRLYDVQHDQPDDALPTRGDLMLGETGLTAPRVFDWRWQQQPGGGLRMAVDWAQAVALTDDAGTVATGDDLLELRGSRVTNEDGKYRYASRVYAATAETQASNIPALFTNTAATTDSDTRLARRLTGVARNNTLLPGVWLLTAQYVGFEAHELKFLRDFEANVLSGPRGTQVFVEKAAASVTKALGLLGTYFPGTTPPLPCISARPQWHPFGIDGIAFITARYGLVSSGYRRKHGFMRLTAKVMSRSKRKLTKDLDEKVIEGWDGTELWQVVPSPETGRTASHFMDDVVTFLRIETALLDSEGILADALALKNHVNSDSFILAQYGPVEEGTFRSVGTEVVSTYDADITPINYYIEVEPEGWNNILYSQKSHYRAREVPVFDADGVDTGEKHDVLALRTGFDSAGKATEPELRTIHPEVAFSRFMDGLLKWRVS